MKLSKSAKARIKRMSNKEQKEVLKAANLLANVEVITNDRFNAVRRACVGKGPIY